MSKNFLQNPTSKKIIVGLIILFPIILFAIFQVQKTLKPTTQKPISKPVMMPIPKEMNKEITPARNPDETDVAEKVIVIKKEKKLAIKASSALNRSSQPGYESAEVTQLPETRKDETEKADMDHLVQRDKTPRSNTSQAGIEGVNRDTKDELQKESLTTQLITKIDKKDDTFEEGFFLTLKDIKSRDSEEELSVFFWADGPIEKYKYFFLNNPPRLIIDLAGKWKKLVPSSVEVENDMISLIRVWNHPDKLRIVMDLKDKQSPSPVIKESPEGLIVTIKK